MRKDLFTLLLAGSMMIASTLGVAQTQEQDYAHQCVQSGKCLPLDRVIGLAKARVQGRFIGNEIDDAQARLGVIIYRLTFMKDSGEVTRLNVDARTGRVLSVE